MADEVKNTLEIADQKKATDAQAKQKRVEDLEQAIKDAEIDLKKFSEDGSETVFSLPPEHRTDARIKLREGIVAREKEIETLKLQLKSAKEDAKDAVKDVGVSEKLAVKREAAQKKAALQWAKFDARERLKAAKAGKDYVDTPEIPEELREPTMREILDSEYQEQ